MNNIFVKIGEFGIIPVIKVEKLDDAVPLAKALCAGGLPLAEIMMRTDCAAGAIQAITQALPDMLIGAGTVLTREQAEEAIKAGASFIVSPGFNPNVVGFCVEHHIPVAPGCCTPSDVEAAVQFGLDVVKFFPAEPAGSIPMLHAMSAPYQGIKFIPTGGINENNLAEYLKNDCVLACGGTFVAEDEWVRSGQFEKVTAMAKKAISAMFGFKLAHIGINCGESQKAAKNAAMIEAMFGFSPKDGPLGIMCDGQFEFMKVPFFGDYGHIAIATASIERAMAYFTRMGFSFRENGIILNDQGKINAAYFEGDFFGCALHLVRSAK